MKKTIDAINEQMIKIRHQLHSLPELPFKEEKTSLLVRETLEKEGYDIIPNLGKTGFIAVLDTGRTGKTIAFHANMDALPILEKNSIDYASKNTNVMHACGHDGHTTITLTAGIALAKNKDLLNGKIVLLFQPAEEIGEGALAMIKDGALNVEKIDHIFGFHNYPSMKIGEIALRSGIMFAGIIRFNLIIEGGGGHGHVSGRVNPIIIVGQLIEMISGISKHLKLLDKQLIVTLNEIHSEEGMNTIPSKAVITGSVRAQTLEISAEAVKLLKLYAKNFSTKHGVQVSFVEVFKIIPIINNEQDTNLIKDIAMNQLGKENVTVLSEPFLAYDDFAYFIDKTSGCYFLFGNGEHCPMVHMNDYDFCDETISIAANILCEAALRLQ